MVATQDVVTRERFESAPTYQQFMGLITKNQDQFQANYDGTTVSGEYKRRLQALVAKPNGPKKLFVLGCDWCPDVLRGLPVLQKMAEAGGIDLRVVDRDENLDIMNAYLFKGEFQSVPCALFYTDDLRLILVWHERPQKAIDEMPLMAKLREGKTPEEAAPLMREFRNGPIWAGWRDATIEEITRLLEEAVK